MIADMGVPSTLTLYWLNVPSLYKDTPAQKLDARILAKKKKRGALTHIQRGLATHGHQYGVWPLFLDDTSYHFWRNRKEVDLGCMA